MYVEIIDLNGSITFKRIWGSLILLNWNLEMVATHAPRGINRRQDIRSTFSYLEWVVDMSFPRRGHHRSLQIDGTYSMA